MVAINYAVGMYNNDTTGAAACNQPGGKWAVNVLYNQHQLFSNAGNWDSWAELDGAQGGPYPPYLCIQVSPAPGGAAFNAADWANNHIAQFEKLAKNVAALGDKVITVQLGWEWNSGGACDKGWDAQGNQALYIRFFRNLAKAFQKYAPNVIRVWAMNHIIMHYGKPEDFYPGDAYVDGIGVEVYQQWVGGNSSVDTSLNNDFGWLDKMTKATFLGANHPKTVDGEAVTFGGRKYIVLAEFQQNTPQGADYVQKVFAWAQAAERVERMLVLCYWQAYDVGQDAGNNVLTVNNGAGKAWIAAMKDKIYSHRWPIPRLSGTTPPVVVPPWVKITPSPDNTVVGPGKMLGDNDGNGWLITPGSKVNYNGQDISYTQAVTQLAKANGGAMWQEGSATWWKFGPVDGAGVPTYDPVSSPTSPIVVVPPVVIPPGSGVTPATITVKVGKAQDTLTDIKIDLGKLP